MPIFEYHCPHCDCEFELLVRGSEEPACPECGTKRIQKLLSAPAGHASGTQSAGSTYPSCPFGGDSPCEPGSCPMRFSP
ncbi:MAG TPA: zinc ribbon domain-containing protein [Planctomycetaceae bacterium]|nr:zinc ribbon domain-containing protein [Planctomycetaceae bacterium]